MGNPLWAPWRMEYILAPKDHKECIFCGVERADDEERRGRLVVCRTQRAYVMLNRYPFASGHLLIIPYTHAGALESLSDDDYTALFRLVRELVPDMPDAELYRTLNMGIGMVVVCAPGELEAVRDSILEDTWVIGELVDGQAGASHVHLC